MINMRVVTRTLRDQRREDHQLLPSCTGMSSRGRCRTNCVFYSLFIVPVEGKRQPVLFSPASLIGEIQLPAAAGNHTRVPQDQESRAQGARCSGEGRGGIRGLSGYIFTSEFLPKRPFTNNSYCSVYKQLFPELYQRSLALARPHLPRR